MERDAAAAIPCRRWAEDVIVLSSGRPPWQPLAAEGPETPPEKLYYKTKLCEKYEVSGHCTYEDGCTFAHGRAELRPPVPPPPSAPHGFGSVAWRSRLGGPEHEQQGGRGGGGGGYGGRVCHNFRDRGSCHFGDSCAFPHASPAPPGPAIRGPGEQKLAAEARRSATPPLRPATAPRHAGALAPGRAFPPVPAAAARDRLRQTTQEDGGGGGKASVLALLGLRKTNGIYGDWPEQYQH